LYCISGTDNELNVLQLHWHPPNPARHLAGAGLGRISEKCCIPDLLEPETKSGTTVLYSHKNHYMCSVLQQGTTTVTNQLQNARTSTCLFHQATATIYAIFGSRCLRNRRATRMAKHSPPVSGIEYDPEQSNKSTS